MPTEIHKVTYLLECKALADEIGFKIGYFVGINYSLAMNAMFLKGEEFRRNILCINML